MPGLSVDVDLTYVPVAPRAASLAEIDAAMKRIAELVKKAIADSKITMSGSEEARRRRSPLLRCRGRPSKRQTFPPRAQTPARTTDRRDQGALAPGLSGRASRPIASRSGCEEWLIRGAKLLAAPELRCFSIEAHGGGRPSTPRRSHTKSISRFLLSSRTCALHWGQPYDHRLPAHRLVRPWRLSAGLLTIP
jgi:hypothetical protein